MENQNPQYQQNYQQQGYQQNYQQPYQQPQYQQAPPQQPYEPKPGNNLVWAILVTLFCCLPFGIISIVYASKVDGLWYAGDKIGARNAAKTAGTWALVGAISSLVVWIIYIIFVVAVGAGATGAFLDL